MARTLPAILIVAGLSACHASAESDPVIAEIKRAETKTWMKTTVLSLDGFQAGQDTADALGKLSELGWTQENELDMAYARQLSAPLSRKAIIFSKDDWTSDVCNLIRFVFIEDVDGVIESAVGATGEAGCL